MSSLRDWLFHPPSTPVPTEALVVIASVAVVIWTGGFIVRGWMQTTASLVAGMNYLQFAFFGSILGLLGNPITLRSIAVAFFVYYIVFFRQHSALIPARDREVRLVVPLFHAVRVSGPRFWFGVQAVELIPLALVFFWPQARVIAWSCTIMTFLGYQILLTFVYSDVLAKDGGERRPE